MKNNPVLVTHSGKFHADDVLAYAMLKVAFGLRVKGEDHTLLRTRDAQAITRADIVWDVGFEYDPERLRFDHHQRDRALRPDGNPYSAAGLVWKAYGKFICRNLLGRDDKDVFQRFDQDVVYTIDLQDNGLASSQNTLDISHIIDDLNPSWDGHDNVDNQFLRAAEFADVFMRNRVSRLASRYAASVLVQEAVHEAVDPRIIELAQGMPWKGAVRNMGNAEVAYAIYPTSAGTWAIDSMPADNDPLGQRAPLPAQWSGLEASSLQRVSGVRDAVFVHLKRFCGAAGSREGAMMMARRSLDMLTSPTATVIHEAVPEVALSPAERAKAALMSTVNFNTYYVAKGYRPEIKNSKKCVEAVLIALGNPLPLSDWKIEAAEDALIDTFRERMQGTDVQLLNARECVNAIADTYAAASDYYLAR